MNYNAKKLMIYTCITSITITLLSVFTILKANVLLKAITIVSIFFALFVFFVSLENRTSRLLRFLPQITMLVPVLLFAINIKFIGDIGFDVEYIRWISNSFTGTNNFIIINTLFVLFLLGIEVAFVLLQLRLRKYAGRIASTELPDKYMTFFKNVIETHAVFWGASLAWNVFSLIQFYVRDFLIIEIFDMSKSGTKIFNFALSSFVCFIPNIFIYFAYKNIVKKFYVKKGDYILALSGTVIDYVGKVKKIIVPNDYDKFDSAAFYNCNSDIEIYFPEGIKELPVFKFRKSIPNIYYPSTLVCLEEFSVLSKKTGLHNNQETIKALLRNKDFEIIDDCMINVKTKTLLFQTKHSNSVLKVPSIVENIEYKAFMDYGLEQKENRRLSKEDEKNNYIYPPEELIDDLLDFEIKNAEERVSLRKIILSKNIKHIDERAFDYSSTIMEIVVPENFIIKFSEGSKANYLIKNNGSEKKITHRMIERLLKIHEKIKSGCYPNSKQLAYDLEASEPTINRDIEYLRDSHDAPIEYDYTNRGYYYTRDYDLKF